MNYFYEISLRNSIEIDRKIVIATFLKRYKALNIPFIFQKSGHKSWTAQFSRSMKK